MQKGALLGYLKKWEGTVPPCLPPGVPPLIERAKLKINIINIGPFMLESGVEL